MSGKLNFDSLVQMIGEERENSERKELLHKEEEKEKLSFSTLLETIREVRESYDLLGEAEKKDPPKSIPLEEWLPSIGISEDWGKLGDKSREQLQIFVNKLNLGTAGEGDLGMFERRMRSLADFVNEKCETTASANFARIVLLDICHSIVGGFSSSAAGFIFEAFAAIMAGTAGEQVAGGKLPIVDFRDGKHNYSLKLIAEKTSVEGSFQLLLSELSAGATDKVREVAATAAKEAGAVTNEAIDPTPAAEMRKQVQFPNKVRYIITYKEGDKKDPLLKFYYFDLSNETFATFLNVMVPATRSKLFKKESKYFKKAPPKNATLYQLYPHFTEEQEQFHFTKTQLQSLEKHVHLFAEFKHPLSGIRKKATDCAESLQKMIVPFYSNVKELTSQMNIYFVGRSTQKPAASTNVDNIMNKELPESYKNIKQAIEKER